MKTKTIETIEEALAAAGVTARTLSQHEKKQIDEQGFIVLENLLPRKEVEQFRTIFEEAFKLGKQIGNETGGTGGTRHVGALLEDFPQTERLFTDPHLMAATHQILKRGFYLNGMHGRDPLPGFGAQGLHPDAPWQNYYGQYHVVTAIWMLDDFTPDNGPTRVVPGSHLSGGKPDKKQVAPTAVHPRQVLVTGKAGSLLVFNGHVWHSGTQNNGKKSRRAVIVSFYGAEQRMMEAPRLENLEALSPVARYLLKGETMFK
jgi:ectoine hydroxylase-related dioxygenase (phytanoyl-CoA dioxygenase family)